MSQYKGSMVFARNKERKENESSLHIDRREMTGEMRRTITHALSVRNFLN